MNVELRAMWKPGVPIDQNPAAVLVERQPVFFRASVDLPFIPVIGDTLMLPDDGGMQDVTVSERVIHLDGRIELWVGDRYHGFPGWDRDDVGRLFRNLGGGEK